MRAAARGLCCGGSPACQKHCLETREVPGYFWPPGSTRAMGWRRVPSFPIKKGEDPSGELRRDPGSRRLRLLPTSTCSPVSFVSVRWGCGWHAGKACRGWRVKRLRGWNLGPNLAAKRCQEPTRPMCVAFGERLDEAHVAKGRVHPLRCAAVVDASVGRSGRPSSAARAYRLPSHGGSQ